MDYDVVIVGAGPAGLTAGLYASRSRLKTLILERAALGGQIAITHEVANYPGSVHEKDQMDTTGPALVERMDRQAKAFGCERKSGNVKTVIDNKNHKVVMLTDGSSIKCKVVILANGALPRKLGVPGELELTGKGVSYCATCDANFFEDMEVYVVGGSFSAVEEALYLAKFAAKVTILVRRDKFRSIGALDEKVAATKNVEVWFNTSITKIEGDGMVERMEVINNISKEKKTIEANEDDGTFGIFPFVGFIPNTQGWEKVIKLDKDGYIITDENMNTNVKGILAAGDIRPKSLRQVVTAAADGAIAATTAEKICEEH